MRLHDTPGLRLQVQKMPRALLAGWILRENRSQGLFWPQNVACLNLVEVPGEASGTGEKKGGSCRGREGDQRQREFKRPLPPGMPLLALRERLGPEVPPHSIQKTGAHFLPESQTWALCSWYLLPLS